MPPSAAARSPRADRAIAAVRSFNRFYTRRVGALGPRLLDSPYSLTEMRVLYELAHRDRLTATALGRELGLDAGYLSRILQRFEMQKLVSRTASNADGRQSHLTLTRRGRAAFAPLEARQQDEVGALLDALPAGDRRVVVDAMQTIERILNARQPSREAYLLRTHQPGDMGWVVHRHGAIYAQERGYNGEFEALVARIVADFLDHFDAARERCWIAERNGEIAGSVFLVAKSKTVAKLRLLLVEPSARGLGIGRRLVAECVRFAREAGYKSITLWTQDDLAAARSLYKEAGFRRVEKTPHYSFGQDLVAETWVLRL